MGSGHRALQSLTQMAAAGFRGRHFYFRRRDAVWGLGNLLGADAQRFQSCSRLMRNRFRVGPIRSFFIMACGRASDSAPLRALRSPERIVGGTDNVRYLPPAGVAHMYPSRSRSGYGLGYRFSLILFFVCYFLPTFTMSVINRLLGSAPGFMGISVVGICSAFSAW